MVVDKVEIVGKEEGLRIVAVVSWEVVHKEQWHHKEAVAYRVVAVHHKEAVVNHTVVVELRTVVVAALEGRLHLEELLTACRILQGVLVYLLICLCSFTYTIWKNK